MIKPIHHGTLSRAVITAIFVLLAARLGLSTQAEAVVFHLLHEHCHHPRTAGSVCHGNIQRTNASRHTGAIKPTQDHPFSATPRAVESFIAARAVALGVPARLALAVARFESGLRMSMHGAAGERGAMQVLPQTARQVGVTGNLYGAAGIEAGVRYLKLALMLHRRAGWCAVASAYNSGVWRGAHCTDYGRAVAALAAVR